MRTFIKKTQAYLNQSYTQILRINFILIITAVTFIFGLLISLALTRQVIMTTKNNNAIYMRLLTETVFTNDREWNRWILKHGMKHKQLYVYINIADGKKGVVDYYSPRTEKFLSQVKKVLGSKRYYRYQGNYYYYTSAKRYGNRYYMWWSMTGVIDILKDVLIVILAVWLLLIITSPFYIEPIAKRLAQPIQDLDNNVNKLPKETQKTLSVPAWPHEVHDLTENFNHLLVRLYQQNQKEKDFVNNAAHELKTPIATIKSHVQLIKRRGKTNPQIIDKSLTYIASEVEHMNQLIEELLILARTAQKLELQKEKLDLEVLTFELLESLPLKQKIKVIGQGSILADREALRHILENLLTNAGKYAPADSEIEITIAERSWTITNHGPMINENDQAHLFERFFRGADVRGKIKGTGLGLAIVAQLAHRNALKVEVTSTKKATSFTIVQSEI
ncbi:HAMP domain-containing histidine kinase [Ligilactobacillus equi]|uniref:sensor histidine kinase n=1 Tax=Ligilactobacillus equi TaxID=137357 RepID=UPI002ECFFE73